MGTLREFFARTPPHSYQPLRTNVSPPVSNVGRKHGWRKMKPHSGISLIGNAAECCQRSKFKEKNNLLGVKGVMLGMGGKGESNTYKKVLLKK